MSFDFEKEVPNPKNSGFLTGSRVYGTPRPDSDWDLVVLVDPETAYALASAFCDTDTEEFATDAYKGCGFQVTVEKNGKKLNLLVSTTQKAFDQWRTGTESLKKRKPVTREFACEVFKALREANND